MSRQTLTTDHRDIIELDVLLCLCVIITMIHLLIMSSNVKQTLVHQSRNLEHIIFSLDFACQLGCLVTKRIINIILKLGN